MPIFIAINISSYYIIKDFAKSDIEKIQTTNSTKQADLKHEDIFFDIWIYSALLNTMLVVLFFIFLYILITFISKKFMDILNQLNLLMEKQHEHILKDEKIFEINKIFKKIKKLSRRVEKREKKIRKYNMNLRLRNRQNSEIISAIGHEFKNPIAIILGYIETLTEDKNINENIRFKFLQKIEINAKKLSHLIDRLYLASKLESKALELRKTNFNLNELCTDISALLRDKYKDRELICSCENVIIFADKMLLEIVIFNLLENAIKYSDGKVELNAQNGMLKVIDSGLGIKEEELELITKKFYRIEQNSWNSSLGLGLSIVKYILKMHSSSLYIESVYKEGSTFYFNYTNMIKLEEIKEEI